MSPTINIMHKSSCNIICVAKRHFQSDICISLSHIVIYHCGFWCWAEWIFNQCPCFFLTVNRVYVKPEPLWWSTMTPAKNGCQSNRASKASAASTSTTTLSTIASVWWESNCRTSRWDMNMGQQHKKEETVWYDLTVHSVCFSSTVPDFPFCLCHFTS